MLHSAPMRTTLFLLAALLPAADNPVAVDNERVKVLTVTNKPGQKSQPHRHDVNRPRSEFRLTPQVSLTRQPGLETP